VPEKPSVHPGALAALVLKRVSGKGQIPGQQGKRHFPEPLSPACIAHIQFCWEGSFLWNQTPRWSWGTGQALGTSTCGTWRHGENLGSRTGPTRPCEACLSE
jgi:hypothetical protein